MNNDKFNGTSYRVRFSRVAFGSFIAFTVLCGIITLLFPVLCLLNLPESPSQGNAIAFAIIFGVGTVILACLTASAKRWGIAVSADKLEYTPLMGEKIIYRWEDIVRVVAIEQPFGFRTTYKVYTKEFNSKAFSFSSLSIGGEKFADDLHKRGFLL